MTAPNTPIFTAPAANPSLSNKRGSNQTTDAIALALHAVNQRGAADLAQSIHVWAQRSVVRGAPEQIESAWDSAWWGKPGLSSLLSNAATGPNASVVYGGRVYVLQPPGGALASGIVSSAPLNGANIGSWRVERYMPTTGAADVVAPGALALVNGHLYANTQGNIYWCTIQADGTLSPWATAVADASTAGSNMIAWDKNDGSGTGLLWLFHAGATMAINVYPVNADGTLGTGASTTVFGANQAYCGLAVDPINHFLYVVGGENSGTGVPTGNAWYNSFNTSTGALGASWLGAANLPAARSRFAMVTQFNGSGFANQYQLWVLGGVQVSAGAALATIYDIGINDARTSTNAWVTVTPASNLSIPSSGCTGVMTGPQFNATVSPSAALPWLAVLGGNTSAAVQVAPAGGLTIPLAWQDSTMAASPLTAAQLGTGGAVTNNLDGSQDIGFQYNGFAVPAILSAGFSDGDQVQFFAQLTDQAGDASPVSTVVTVKVAQPPALTNITPSPPLANPTTAPTASDVVGSTSLPAGNYVGGYTFKNANGETLISPLPAAVALTAGHIFQLVTPSVLPTLPNNEQGVTVEFYLTSAPGGVTLGHFASQPYGQGGIGAQLLTTTQANGVAAPGSNTTGSTSGQPALSFSYNAAVGLAGEAWWRIQVQNLAGSVTYYDSGVVYGNKNSAIPQLAPMLASGTSYKVTMTVASLDSPMSGSTNVGSASFNITPVYVIPSTPTSVTAVPDNVNALVTVTWTNPGGSAATANRIYIRVNGASTWQLAKDNIVAVIGSAQSFQLADNLPLEPNYDYAVSAISATGESALSAIVSNVPIAPDYHFDTGGYVAVLHVVGTPSLRCRMLLNAPPTITTHIDTEYIPTFGDPAPRGRFGLLTYREIDLQFDLAISGAGDLPSALDAVMSAALNGSVLCYRDVIGNLIYCGPMADRSRTPDLYSGESLKLAQVQYTYAP